MVMCEICERLEEMGYKEGYAIGKIVDYAIKK